MKSLKRVMCTVLASTMMLGLVACGSDEKGKEAGDKTGSASPAEGNGVMSENKLETAKVSNNTTVFNKDEGFTINGLKGEEGQSIVAGDYIYLSTNDSGVTATSTDVTAGTVIGNAVITEDNIPRLYKIPAAGGDAELIYEGTEQDKGCTFGRFVLGAEDTVYFMKTNEMDYSDVKMMELSGGQVSELGDANILYDDKYIETILADKNGHLIVLYEGSEIKTFDKSLNVIATCKADGLINMGTQDANGDIVFAVTSFDGDVMGKTELKKYDAEAGKLGEGQEMNVNGLSSLEKGTDGYDIYYSTESNLYGYNYDGNKTTEVADYNASGINTQYIRWMVVPNADNIICAQIDADYNAIPGIIRYSKMDPSDVGDRNVITIACMDSSGDLKQIVLDYNNSQSDNMISLVDYSQVEDPMSKFSADISAGTVPDLYAIGSNFGDMSIRQCVAKGMFEDLTPYLEKDEELSVNDFIPSVYNSMLLDGKLYYTCTGANLYSIAGKKSELGDEAGWTEAEMKEYVSSKPDARLFSTNNKNDMLSIFMWGCSNDFVNWESGECSFTSQDFKDIMEVCNNGINEEMDYESVGSEIGEIADGSRLFVNRSFNAMEYASYENATNGELTFKGFPNSSKARGKFMFPDGVAMSAQCENKEAAWDFVRYLLTEDCQSKSYLRTSGFPIREDVYEAYISKCSCTEPGTDKYGNEIRPEISEGNGISVDSEKKPLTQDEAQNFRKLIDESSGIYGCDPKLWDIIGEEAAAYFSGDKSLDDVCSIIQDRVTTYVNECK